jgi:hypothetical protein
MNAERCTWCGEAVEADDGFRADEPAGERRAAFCRLEHVVPWAIQGAHWEAGEPAEPADIENGALRCAHCDAEVGDTRVLLVRHRGDYRISDPFCSVDHLADWAKAGGRWQ